MSAAPVNAPPSSLSPTPGSAPGDSIDGVSTETVVPVEIEVESCNVIIRPVDYGWVMGDDWQVRVAVDSSIPDLKHMISRERQIPFCRILIRMPDGKYQDKKREKWTLRRNQITDGSIIQVEPTIRGAWTWNTPKWYRDNLIRDINALLDAATNGIAENHRLTTEELMNAGLFVPPPLGDITLRTFIRSYPEHFQMHCDMTSGLYWVKRTNELYTLPTFGYYPAELGTVKHFRERKFQWEKYEDLDDRKRVELDFEIPDVSYNFEVLRANDLMRADVFGSSDPIGFVKWFNCVEWIDIGKTSQRRNTLNPEWRDARFVLSVNASFEVENCILLIELFDVDAGLPGEEDELGDFLGCIMLTGRDLQRLLADGRTAVRTFSLQQRQAQEGMPPLMGDPEADQSGVKGTITVKGGKAGFEICLQAARDLVIPRNPTSKPFAVVLWCGDELGETLPDSKTVRDPQWDETLGIPTLGASISLMECTLEVQVWCTVGKLEEGQEENPDHNPDARGDFLGAYMFKDEELIHLFTSSTPWACSMRKQLKQSKNVPIKMRKKSVGGVLCVLGGLSGLASQPGKVLDFTFTYADRIAKLYKVWFSLDWNYVRSYTSTHERVVNMQCHFNQRIRLETSAGANNCLDSHLRIDLWESTEGSIGALDPAYLGMVVVQGEELSALADRTFAQIKRFDLVLNPSLEPRKQRMIRGGIFLRGGSVMCRCENERVLIIYAARNLARANFGGFGSSDPFVEIHLNTLGFGLKGEIIPVSTLVARSATIENCLTPVWDETKETYFVTIPLIREYNEKEMKALLKANEKLDKEGKPPRERTMYDEMSLQIAVYDEKGEGEKGLCLGIVRFDEADLLKFFESYEPIEEWYPLAKGTNPKDKATYNASIGTGAEIRIGTTGHRYNSPEAGRLEKEQALEKARQEAAEAKAEAEAIEFAQLEREREDQLAAEEEAARLAEVEKTLAENAAAETDRLLKEKLAADKAKAAADKAANEEAYRLQKEAEE